MRSRLVVWYNTKCPVCDGGINWQRNRLVRAARAGAIEFRNINLEPEALARFGAGIEEVRRRLHAVDAEGRLRRRDLAAYAGRRMAWPTAGPARRAPDRPFYL
jgi:predicted DCC family thiol-disulfide oxidoreductase YuxK